MVTRRQVLIGGAALTAVSAVSPAKSKSARPDQSDGFVATGAPWPLRDSEAFEYDSKAVGDRMAIGVWSPPQAFLEKSGEKSPPLNLIYVLDGSWALSIAAAICYLQYVDRYNPGFPPVLLVGVDYPIGRKNARSRDYTMANSVPAFVQKELPGTTAATFGGADRFLAFLTDELDPFIRSKYHVAEGPAGILGDSFGGTFTFYAFLKQSGLFDRYWLGSPGVFSTSADYVGQLEAQLKKGLVHPTKMFLSMGTREMNGGDTLYDDMGQNFNRIISALSKSANRSLKWKYNLYPGYSHTQVVVPAMTDAVLYLYGKDSINHL